MHLTPPRHRPRRAPIPWLGPALAWALLVSGLAGCAAREHPFLITSRDEFPGLQARADQSPWKEMRAEAIRYTLEHEPSDDGYRLGAFMQHASLAYILDPPRRAVYARKVIDGLMQWEAIYNRRPEIKVPIHHYVVTEAGVAFFLSVLALDIVHDDIPPDQLAEIERRMDRMARWYEDLGRHPLVTDEQWSAWPLNRYANVGIWALYRGDRHTFEHARDRYRFWIEKYITPDGVFNQGTAYGPSRLNHRRHSKAHFIDVLEYTGEDSYYDDPRMVNYFEWVYGHSVSPSRMCWPFGDTSPNTSYTFRGPAMFTAHRYSPLAAGYAAWAYDNPHRDHGLITTLLHYILRDRPMSEPIAPSSRVYPNGGAFFVEPPASPDSLAVAIWNPRETDEWSHSHYNVNSINIHAYGDYVLRNVGYAGSDQHAEGFSWDYIHNDAEASNNALVGHGNHQRRSGNGIIEHLTAPGFDYARGDSGQAMAYGRHHRSLIMVHRQTERPGYVVVFDEARTARPGDALNLLWHPQTEEVRTVVSGLAYRSAIWPLLRDDDTQRLELHTVMVTEPDWVDIRRGVLAQFRQSVVGQYLYATYRRPDHDRVSALTIHLPQDRSRAAPAVTVDRGENGERAEVGYPDGTRDTVIRPEPGGSWREPRARLDGDLLWCRHDGDGSLAKLFVRGGTAAWVRGFAFESAEPVSLLLDEARLEVIVPPSGTTLTTRLADGRARVHTLPAGRHQVDPGN